MTNPPFGPYASWLSDDSGEHEVRRTAPYVIIGYRNRTKAWAAIWTDKASNLGRFEGTREEVIAWARERCDDIRIVSGPPDEDHLYPVQLGPDDE